jgi:peptide/nickel transport system substrate-binding protein
MMRTGIKAFFLPVIAIALLISNIACSSATTTTSTSPTVSAAPTTGTLTSTAPTTVTKTTASVTPTTTPSPQPSTTPSNKPTSAPATPTPQYGSKLRTLSVTGPAAPIGWPPEAVGASTPSGKPTLESLVREDNSGHVTPWLAESWQVAPDGKSITFKLVKGVKFHDSTDFNAQAVKFNMDAVMAAKKAGTSLWTSVDAVDDYTVKLNLKQYQNSILSLLAVSTLPIVSPTAYKTRGIDWARWNPVGTGPFIFVSFERDVSMKFTKFDGYWQKGLPYLDGMEVFYIQDPLTRSAAFQSGYGHVINSADAKSAYDLAAKGYEVINRVSGYSVLLPDSTHSDSPLANPKVRQAIEYAIDKVSMAKTLGYGYTDGATQATVPDGMAYNPDIKGRPYDVAKAKQLLTEAGYPNGFTTTITPDPQTYDANAVLAIQSYLSKVGINAKINVVDAGKYTDLRSKGWTGLLSCAFSEYPNYGATMQTYISSDSTQFNTVNRPDNYQETLSSALAATDFNTQKALCQKLVKIIYDDAMIIPINTGANRNVLQLGIHGHGYFTTGHFICWTPETTWMEKTK